MKYEDEKVSSNIYIIYLNKCGEPKLSVNSLTLSLFMEESRKDVDKDTIQFLATHLSKTWQELFMEL